MDGKKAKKGAELCARVGAADTANEQIYSQAQAPKRQAGAPIDVGRSRALPRRRQPGRQGPTAGETTGCAPNAIAVIQPHWVGSPGLW